ncbi:NHL repeat-containing protein [Spirosoma arcticum]
MLNNYEKNTFTDCPNWLAGCEDHRNFPAQNLNVQPRIAYNLPEQYNTPDGLALTPDNNMLLSVPNPGNPAYPPVILRLTDKGYAVFANPAPSPATGKASPFDLAYGPDGNVYYADNQFNNDPNFKSRLMRIRIVNGQPMTIEPVVEGFRLSNAVVWRENIVYVSDSQWDLPGVPNGSAIFKFTLNELNAGGPIQLQLLSLDPHILTTFTTQVGPDGDDLGADGVDYDSQGNLFTGLFGDGTMYKMILNPNGSLASKTQFANVPNVDGIIINRSTDNIYVCDAKTNAIRVVSPTGDTRVVSQNGGTHAPTGAWTNPPKFCCATTNCTSPTSMSHKRAPLTQSTTPRTPFRCWSDWGRQYICETRNRCSTKRLRLSH